MLEALEVHKQETKRRLARMEKDHRWFYDDIRQSEMKWLRGYVAALEWVQVYLSKSCPVA